MPSLCCGASCTGGGGPQLRVRSCRTPLISAGISNLSNFLLDLVFMFAFGWGATGAGLATTAAQVGHVCAGHHAAAKPRCWTCTWC